MNFLELQNAVLGDSFDSAKYRERIKRWLNDAQRRVYRRSEQPDFQGTDDVALVAGASTATLSTAGQDVLRILSVTWFNQSPVSATARGQEVDRVSVDVIDGWDASEGLDVQGDPSMYAIYSTSPTSSLQLLLRPATNVAGVVRVRFEARPPKMVSDTDVPSLDEDYHDSLLVVPARAKCFRDEDDKEMHDSLMADFEGELARFRVDSQARASDAPVQIEGCW